MSNTQTIIRYPVELFQKFRTSVSLNNSNEKLSEFFFTHPTQYSNKLKSSNVFNNIEIKTNLNFLMNKQNLSSSDEELYNLINNKLNKLTDKNFNEIYNDLTNLPYTKAKHMYRLAESIIIKSIRERVYAGKYANLCKKLISYNIIVDEKPIQFRDMIFLICQDIFNELIFDPIYDLSVKKKQEYDRQIAYDTLSLPGLTNFMGHLNNISILSNNVILFCCNKLLECIRREKENLNKYLSLLSLLELSIKNIKTDNLDDYNKLHNKIKSLKQDEEYTEVNAKYTIEDILDLFN